MLNKPHIYLLLGALLSSNLGSGQSTFNTYYPSGIQSLANKISNVNVNNFILSSYYVDGATGLQGLDLKRLDNQGQVQLWKRFLFRNYDYLSFLNNNVQVDISNTTMMLTGDTYINNDPGVIFASINKSTLDTNWVKYYSDGIYNYYLNNVFKTKPNEVWFMGDKGNNNGYISRPVVIKTDTLGNLLSIKEFTNLVGYLENTIYFDTSSNLLYISGNTVINPAIQQSFIVCADTLGNIVWNQQLGNNPYTTTVNQIIKRNNYLILGGFKWSSGSNGTNRYKICLTKLNSGTGSTIWQKTYGWEGIFNNLKACFVNPDESIVAVGAMQFPIAIGAPNPNAIILKANSNGDSLWLKSYSTYTATMEEQFLDVQASPDGGYIACGAPTYQTNYHSWVVKTDSLGNAPGIYTNTVYLPPPPTNTTTPGEDTLATGLDENRMDATFSIFPNPSDQVLNIEFGSRQVPYKTFLLYNYLGQLLREEDLSFVNNTATIKTDRLIPGIYFIQLKNNNTKSKTQKIIVSH